jgi:precorrin-2/cobalt-factor-2 C20-methyltransferase
VSGRLIGVGVGPGDPELMTLKAARTLASADVVAYFAKEGHRGNARPIATPSAISSTHRRPRSPPISIGAAPSR